jgi:tetratricopeptide (TPR) repeat protein
MAHWQPRSAIYRLTAPIAILALSLVPLLCSAQAPAGLHTEKEQPHSFSNRGVEHKATMPPSKVIDDVKAEPNTADAIAGDALAQIYDAADEHFHKGEWNHCINLNQIVMEGDPHNVNAYANNAYLLWSSDRDAQGISTLKKGIAANPNTYFMYDELGQYYWLHHKDAVHAVPYYEQAIKYKCPSITWHGLAHCYEILGQWDKALAAWQTASGYPGDAAAKVNLKRVQAAIAKRQAAGH